MATGEHHPLKVPVCRTSAIRRCGGVIEVHNGSCGGWDLSAERHWGCRLSGEKVAGGDARDLFMIFSNDIRNDDSRTKWGL